MAQALRLFALEIKLASALSLFKKKKKHIYWLNRCWILFHCAIILKIKTPMPFFFFYLSLNDKSDLGFKVFLHSYTPGQISLDVSSIQKAIVQSSTQFLLMKIQSL